MNLEFKEGQTYICTKTANNWFTEGKEYKVFYNGIYGKLVIEDDEGSNLGEGSINLLTKTEFKLKEENKC